MTFRTIITGLMCILLCTPAGAAEPSLDWPFYRAAMQWEAVAESRGESVRFPWARELNQRIGFRASAAPDADIARLEAIVSLSIARLWSRLKGPPALPSPEGIEDAHCNRYLCKNLG